MSIACGLVNVSDYVRGTLSLMWNYETHICSYMLHPISEGHIQGNANIKGLYTSPCYGLNIYESPKFIY